VFNDVLRAGLAGVRFVTHEKRPELAGQSYDHEIHVTTRQLLVGCIAGSVVVGIVFSVGFVAGRRFSPDVDAITPVLVLDADVIVPEAPSPSPGARPRAKPSPRR
jgi:hypothetical protein